MAGHVFVARGEIVRLFCDAWLLPTDYGLGVRSYWRKKLSAMPNYSSFYERMTQLRNDATARGEAWDLDYPRVISPKLWLSSWPKPYLVDVGGNRWTPAEWYAQGARQFCEAANRDLTDEPNRLTARAKRVKPLIALPVVGAGAGGGAERKGALLRALLPELHQCVKSEAFNADIAVVLNDEQDFTVAQEVRRELLAANTGLESWVELKQSLVELGQTLARKARRGELVLFIGAGVSVGAGLPNWDGLLDNLAEKIGFDASRLSDLQYLHTIDRALVIQRRITNGRNPGNKSLGELVIDELKDFGVSLSHSLLACLPVREVVTLNYDCLFEEASHGAGKDVAVLPYQFIGESWRWLLKLHGCVNHPEDIVLTREDYLRYEDRRAALFGLVQALLMTRHMLFVGFGLSDDNFHRIVDEVRKALRGAGGKPTYEAKFGTALVVRNAELLEDIGGQDLDFVEVAPGQDIPTQARLLEILLDYLLSEATQAPPRLLDDVYEQPDSLTPADSQIRNLLYDLMTKAIPEARSRPYWDRIRRLLIDFGAKPDLV